MRDGDPQAEEAVMDERVGVPRVVECEDRVPMMTCPRCRKRQPTYDGVEPLTHGRPGPRGPEDCR